MLNKNVETFLGCDADYQEADTVLYGAPFDSTTSYRPGTRFGSRAIRMESFGIETYSPYQDKDLMDRKIFDSGDLELCFGDTRRALEDIEHRCAVILNDGKRPFLLGGEHLVTLGAVKAVFRKYPDLSSFILMLMRTCVPIILARNCPTPVYSAGAGSCWATDGFSSSASVPVTGKNFPGERSCGNSEIQF